MRINGFEQMKAFYSWVFDNADKSVKPQHISLYIFLLNQNNRSHWVEWFKCPYDLAMQGACIGNKKTYYNCLQDLQNWGLIEYQKGINEWKAPLIRLEPLTDANSVPQSEIAGVRNRTTSVPQGTPQGTTLPTPQGTPQGTQSNKHITNNIKQVTGGVKPKMKIPPSIDEVTAYCLDRKNNVNVKKWYNHYEAKGWMIGKNKMKDWKAAVRTWEEDKPTTTPISDFAKTKRVSYAEMEVDV